MRIMNSERQLFISLIGIDGTGKTTQANALIENLKTLGIKSKYVPGRFERFYLFGSIRNAFIKILASSGKKTDISQEGFAVKKGFFSLRSISSIWLLTVMSDYMLQISLKITIPLRRGESIVSDRYVYDTIVDLAADLKYSEKRMKRLLDLILHISPTPDQVLLIDLPSDLAFQRNKSKNDGIPLDFLSLKRSLYLSLEGRAEIRKIDGSLSPIDISREIIRATTEG